VTIVTTSCHTAVDESEAKLLGMQASAADRPQYRLDLVTATPFPDLLNSDAAPGI
jgi:hypothetical protein